MNHDHRPDGKDESGAHSSAPTHVPTRAPYHHAPRHEALAAHLAGRAAGVRGRRPRPGTSRAGAPHSGASPSAAADRGASHPEAVPARSPRGPARWFAALRRRHRTARAVERAFEEFRATHRAWATSLFDLQLFRGRGAEAIEADDAAALALAWSRQFAYRDERKRALEVRWLEPVARAFLDLLAAKLREGRS